MRALLATFLTVLGATLGDQDVCWEPGTYLCGPSGCDLRVTQASSPQDCQLDCYNADDCYYWTYNTRNECYLQTNDAPANDDDRPEGVAHGSKLCDGDSVCWSPGTYNCGAAGCDLRVVPANSASECQLVCRDEEECYFWTFNDRDECYLQTDAAPDNEDKRSEGVGHGPKFCSAQVYDICWSPGTYNCGAAGCDIGVTQASSPQECQRNCVSDSKCRYWTFNNRNQCYLQTKDAPANEDTRAEGLAHGSAYCSENDVQCWSPGTYNCGAAGCDLQTIQAPSPQDCQIRCQEETSCAFWTYNKSNQCYLQSTAAEQNEDSRPEGVGHAPKYCSGSTACWYPGTYNCGAAGCDIRVTEAFSPQDCQLDCINEDRCQYWTFNNRNQCYLQSEDAPRNNDRRPEGLAHGSKSCRERDTCWSPGTYNCGGPGCDLKSFQTSSSQACQQACRQDDACYYWTFNKWGQCYLQSETAPQNEDSRPEGVGHGPKYCDAPNFEICYEPGSFCWDGVSCNERVTTADSPEDCRGDCENEEDCYNWSLTSQNVCYLQKETASNYGIPTNGASRGAKSCSASSVCWSRGTYNCGGAGCDLKRVTAASPQDCQLLCQDDDACFYWTYNKWRNCYLQAANATENEDGRPEGIGHGPKYCSEPEDDDDLCEDSYY